MSDDVLRPLTLILPLRDSAPGRGTGVVVVVLGLVVLGLVVLELVSVEPVAVPDVPVAAAATRSVVGWGLELLAAQALVLLLRRLDRRGPSGGLCARHISAARDRCGATPSEPPLSAVSTVVTAAGSGGVWGASASAGTAGTRASSPSSTPAEGSRMAMCGPGG